MLATFALLTFIAWRAFLAGNPMSWRNIYGGALLILLVTLYAEEDEAISHE